MWFKQQKHKFSNNRSLNKDGDELDLLYYYAKIILEPTHNL